jgi:hypothetical protein
MCSWKESAGEWGGAGDVAVDVYSLVLLSLSLSVDVGSGVEGGFRASRSFFFFWSSVGRGRMKGWKPQSNVKKKTDTKAGGKRYQQTHQQGNNTTTTTTKKNKQDNNNNKKPHKGGLLSSPVSAKREAGIRGFSVFRPFLFFFFFFPFFSAPPSSPRLPFVRLLVLSFVWLPKFPPTPTTCRGFLVESGRWGVGCLALGVGKKEMQRLCKPAHTHTPNPHQHNSRSHASDDDQPPPDIATRHHHRHRHRHSTEKRHVGCALPVGQSARQRLSVPTRHGPSPKTYAAGQEEAGETCRRRRVRSQQAQTRSGRGW